MKKLFVLLMAVILVLSACSSSDSSETAVNTDTAEKESIEKVSLPVFSWQSPPIADYDNNDLTNLLEGKFNVEFEWTLVPQDATLEKQNVLLASGNYPAVFVAGLFSQNDQIKLGSNGILIPLNDLIAEYGPNIRKAFEKSPYLLKGVTAPDGNIYALPGLEECYHCDYAQKMWINKDWLKKLNLSMPTTTDELYNTLKAFKEKDPNGNGKKDEVPLTGAISWWHAEPTYYLMNSFAYASDANFLTLNNGKVGFNANKPEWKEGLTFIRKLFAEGLIDQQAYTQNFEGLQKIANNPNEVIMGGFTGGCCVPTTGDDGRWTQYEVVPPVKGPGGIQFIGYFGGNVANGQFAITDKATKDQQIRAIQIVDYLFSTEGSLDSMYGPKGIGWFDPKEGETGIDGKPALYSAVEPYERPDKKSVTWDTSLKYTPAELFNGRAQGQDVTKPDGFEKHLAVQTDKLASFKPAELFPQAIWFSPEDALKLAQIKTDITNYINTNAVQFISGQKDLNKDWDAYVNGFGGLGLDEFINKNQEAYDQQYKK